MRRFHDLPSLTSLVGFEAVARQGNMKMAAAELNVTAGAVSRQITALEHDLGVPLFTRTGRGVVLTPDGEELHATILAGFVRISDVVRSIRRGDRLRNVRIATTDTTATMWLCPLMPEFWKLHPDIMIDHLLAENTKVFRPEEVDLRIRFGLGDWRNETAEILFDECIYPVCSPAFALEHATAQSADLPDLPLLDVEGVAPDWISWDEALASANLHTRPGHTRRFGKFGLAILAAQADQGVALGWHRMVRPLIQRGDLVRFTDLVLPAQGSYHLTWNTVRGLSGASHLLHDWIRVIAEQERQSG